MRLIAVTTRKQPSCLCRPHRNHQHLPAMRVCVCVFFSFFLFFSDWLSVKISALWGT